MKKMGWWPIPMEMESVAITLITNHPNKKRTGM
jgi:hypothetical protein